MPVDVSNLASVRDFASSLSALIDSGSLPRIRALICAAAVMQVGGKRVTDDGMEATFQVNYLANFLLVLLLLPVMRRDCRIIFLTSNLILDDGGARAPKLAAFDEYITNLPDPVVEEMGRSKAFAEGTARYAISKVLLSMFAAELQRRLDATNDFGRINVVLLDPGTFISGMISGRSSMPPTLVRDCGDDPFDVQNIRRSSERPRSTSFHFSLIFLSHSRGLSKRISPVLIKRPVMC